MLPPSGPLVPIFSAAWHQAQRSARQHAGVVATPARIPGARLWLSEHKSVLYDGRGYPPLVSAGVGTPKVFLGVDEVRAAWPDPV